MTSNSALARGVSSMRMRPLFKSRLYALSRFSGVETSALGELEPSFVRKTAHEVGSTPCRRQSSSFPRKTPRRRASASAASQATNRSFSCVGVIENPADGWWHETQERPFVPVSVKNSLFRSIAPVNEKFDE